MESEELKAVKENVETIDNANKVFDIVGIIVQLNNKGQIKG